MNTRLTDQQFDLAISIYIFSVFLSVHSFKQGRKQLVDKSTENDLFTVII